MVKWEGGPTWPAREYPAEDRQIRFFFDHGHPWPLRENHMDEYAMTPEDHGLSPELVNLLRRCGVLWECVDFDGRFDPPEVKTQYEEACTQAVKELRAEVYPIKVKRE
ncbi:hypothetical protein GCM10027030_07800 [Luteococcus sediminum]